MKIKRCFPLISIGVLILALGCNGPEKPSDLPKLYPCKITVIQDGKPLEGAMIFVRPPDGYLRFVIGGKTDAKGVAVIKLDGQWEGVPEGEFYVSISKIVTPPGLERPDETTPLNERRRMQEQAAQQTKETVDPKYSDLAKTQLRLKVDQKAVNESYDVGAAVDLSMAELFPGRRAL
ncbi:MAG: DUF4198 domain-containing protein [Planctomycetaceae bacterium]|nr:DUF4198 domain-containing protein [Planctomycetaceae bacterium]